jgi:polysaccharide biosynthesis/export protein
MQKNLKKLLISTGLLTLYSGANLSIFLSSAIAQNATDFDIQNLNPPESLPAIPEGTSNYQVPEMFKIYRLGIGDVININVQRFADLSVSTQVNSEGNIIIPLVGALPILGLTVKEAEKKIQIALDRYVINPIVTVGLQTQRPVQVTILGEVGKPGFYPLNSSSQLTSALLVAGGTSTLADLRIITVRRPVMNGTVIEQQIDLFTPLQNGQSLPDLRLQDGDIVIVPKLAVGNTKDYDRLLVAKSNLAQQQITVRVLSYAGGGLGKLPLPNGSTFIDALTAIAPNPDNANLRDIALIRFDPIQGKAITQKLDGKRAFNGDLAQNVPLQNNDVIVIGRTWLAKTSYALNVFTQPFRDVLGFLLFFDSLANSASNLFSPNRRN